MKKITILFFIVTLSMLGVISGCSDDDGSGGTTDPSINPEDYNFYMIVSDTESREDYVITLIPMNNNIITSIEISVNGVNVTMTNYMDMWSGLIDMEEGQTYQVEATINGINHSLTINTPYVPTVEWPVNWNVTEPTTINWSLAANAEYQEFYATATDYITWDDNYADLSPSDRTFMIPENWVDPLLTDYSLMLIELNFSFEDNLIVSCMSADVIGYGIFRDVSEREKIKISKEIYNRIYK